MLTAEKEMSPAPTKTGIPNSDPRIIQFLDAWKNARTGGDLPYKNDFDPIEIPALLPFVWIAYYDARVSDFIVRLAGNKINDAWGRQIRGLRLRDILGVKNHSTTLNRWVTVLNDEKIEYSAVLDAPDGIEPQVTERMVMPMMDDAGAALYLIGVSLYQFSAQERKTRPPMSVDLTYVLCAEV